MHNDKSFLGIIPARYGSKRLPRKNIRPLCGKSLVSISIESALKSHYLDDTIITSDDPDVLSIGKKYNLHTINRPETLATDETSSVDVLTHTIHTLDKKYDYIVMLQPTSPLRNASHIDQAIELLTKKNADAIISVCETEHTPLWSNTLPNDFNMSHFLSEEVKNKRSQDFPTYYRLNGAIYICKTERFLDEKTLFLKQNIYAYEMKHEHSIDIDNEVDFIVAETLFQKQLTKKEIKPK